MVRGGGGGGGGEGEEEEEEGKEEGEEEEEEGKEEEEEEEDSFRQQTGLKFQKDTKVMPHLCGAENWTLRKATPLIKTNLCTLCCVYCFTYYF